eukprot:Rmarinus@m.14952
MRAEQLLWVALFLLSILRGTTEAQTTTSECPDGEMITFVMSAVDVSLLVSGGCDSVSYDMDGDISKECCDTASVIVAHPCTAASREFFGVDDLYPPHLDYLLQLADLCGLVVGVGYNKTGCGNGIVTENEGCDDGNNVSGDGCMSDCFVEEDYNCYTPSESQPSVCLQCTSNCQQLHRHVCTETGAACGDCIDGYAENEEGDCAAVKHVLYTVINQFNKTTGKDCVYHEVGYALEAIPLSSLPYIDAVRAWMPDRSSLVDSGACNIRHVAKNPPEGDNLVIVMEVVIPRAEAPDVPLKYNTHIVLFSELPQRVVLTAGGGRMFDIYFGSAVYLYDVEVTDVTGYEGGLARSFGQIILEDVDVHGCREDDRWGSSGFVYQCGGLLMYSFGSVYIRDSIIRDSNFGVVENAGVCLIYDNSVMMLMGFIQLRNVSFFNNSAEGNFFDIQYFSEGSEIDEILLRGNTCKRSFVQSDLSILVRNFVAEENTGNLFSLTQSAVVENFEILNNVVVEDGGLIRNMADLLLSNGYISHTTPAGSGGVLVNSLRLFMKNVTFDYNEVGAIRNSGVIHMENCTFVENTATSQFTTIYNMGILEVNDCVFSPKSDGDFDTIWSTREFIVRDSILPDAADLFVATCSSADPTMTASASMSAGSPCGIAAECSQLQGFDGVHCECPFGYVGVPTVVCAPPADVYLLPEQDVTVFLIKTSADSVREETRAMVSDGLGHVSWKFVESTLPPWLRVDPMSGSLWNTTCIADRTDVTLTFIAAGFTAASPGQSASVRIDVNTTYSDFLYESSKYIFVSLDVEVTADPTFSNVSSNPLCNNECGVENGAKVWLRIDIRDAEGLVLGVGGGGGFSVRVVLDTQVASEDASSPPISSSPSAVLVSVTDFEDGTYAASFEAPDTHFAAVVDIDGAHIKGSPVSYRVVCRDGWVWDSGASECTEETPRVPVKVIALAIVSVLVVSGLLAGYLHRRRRAFAFLFRLVLSEVSSIGFSGVGEFFDLLSDMGAVMTVYLTDGLEYYIPYYTIILTIALISSFFYFSVLVSDLKRALRKKSMEALRSVHQRHSTKLRSPVLVVGLGTFHTLEELDEAIEQIERKHRRMRIELMLLAAEDAPMLFLGTSLLMNAGENPPVSVVISLQITCIMLGMTLTNLRGTKEAKDQISRLVKRKALALKQLNQSDPIRMTSIVPRDRLYLR